jgi:outer membrane lipoprotein-sorting protein
MSRHGTHHRATTSATNILNLRPEVVFLLLPMLVALWQSASGQQPETAFVANQVSLTTEQVVHNLVQRNLQRLQALQAYQGTRSYRAEYHGFPGTRSAEMVVSVKYLFPGKKEFSVQSATGSEFIIDKVFKKLLEAENEALDTETQRRSALNDDNYRFTLIGYESGFSGAAYVLHVEPRTKNKFLYRGRIWVDTEDFAVVRLEAEPAKNPSFWTKKAEIVHVYKKVSDFWLPAYNHSVTAMRLGGRAELTIDYKDYEITGGNSISSVSMLRSASEAETARGQQ